MVDPLMTTKQVAFAKCVSQCLKVPPARALSVVCSSLLYHLVFTEAGAL